MHKSDGLVYLASDGAVAEWSGSSCVDRFHYSGDHSYLWYLVLLVARDRESVRKTRKRVKIYLPFFWGDIYNRDALSCVVLVVALPETNMFKKSYKKTGSNELT